MTKYYLIVKNGCSQTSEHVSSDKLTDRSIKSDKLEKKSQRKRRKRRRDREVKEESFTEFTRM